MTETEKRRRRRDKARRERSKATAEAARKSLQAQGEAARQSPDADSSHEDGHRTAFMGSDATGVAKPEERASKAPSKPKSGFAVDRGRRWHVVTARPRWATQAVKDLAKQGIPAMLTHETVELVGRGGRFVQQRQVMRRTMFVGLAPSETLADVEAASFGVRWIERDHDHRPLTVPPGELQDFADSLAHTADEVASAAPFAPGDQVVVAVGPFASFTGVVEEVDDVAKFLSVAVSIFGRSTPVRLEYSQVRKA
ncbi:transcription termination/antitermination protein NusG [Methylobacterium aquaticum]|nr:KOW motif-containing protein [Methylobacterium aquaticum]